MPNCKYSIKNTKGVDKIEKRLTCKCKYSVRKFKQSY